MQIYRIDYDGSNDRVIAEFYGGHGSFNINSWPLWQNTLRSFQVPWREGYSI